MAVCSILVIFFFLELNSKVAHCPAIKKTGRGRMCMYVACSSRDEGYICIAYFLSYFHCVEKLNTMYFKYLIICSNAEQGPITFFVIYDHSRYFYHNVIYDHSRSLCQNPQRSDHDHDRRSFCRSCLSEV